MPDVDWPDADCTYVKVTKCCTKINSHRNRESRDLHDISTRMSAATQTWTDNIPHFVKISHWSTVTETEKAETCIPSAPGCRRSHRPGQMTFPGLWLQVPV